MKCKIRSSQKFLLLILHSLCSCIQFSIEQSFPRLFEGVLKGLGEAMQYINNEPIDQPVLLKEYDFIVIGAGSAGCVIANRLSEISEWNILLIEAGQEENYVMDVPIAANLLQLTDANWNYKTVPSDKYCLGLENRQCRYPRGKVMGGSSVLNYMIYTRGHWKDFDNWADLGNTGWNYQNVLKYFKKLEDVQIPKYASDKIYRNIGGYQTISEVPFHSEASQAFIEAGQELGYPTPDVNGQYQIGFSTIQFTVRNGTRCSTSRAYLHPIRKRRNLHVKKYSLVTKILINRHTKTAYGVEFVRNKSKYRILAKKEIIISAGAINSPQLLMLSGIGPRKHLVEKNIPVVQDLPVGENLMDHVFVGGLSFITNDTVTFSYERMLRPDHIYDFLAHHRGPWTTPGPTALAFVDLQHPNKQDGHPDLELLFINGLISRSRRLLQKCFGIRHDLYKKIYKPIEQSDGITLFPVLLRPKSKGRILLKDSDPFHYPLIYPNYFADEDDLDVLLQGVRLSQKIMKTKAMRRYNTTLWNVHHPGCVNYTYDSDEYWKCYTRQFPFTIYHLAGTCKMAPESDPTGVVDPRLRVKGITNLRVADASIMPEVTSGHTNAPTIMIGEKASDLIKVDWDIKIT